MAGTRPLNIKYTYIFEYIELNWCIKLILKKLYFISYLLITKVLMNDNNLYTFL